MWLLSTGAFNFPSQIAAAEPALGESIYRTVSEAVFLVETLDEEGQVVSVGTAFLIADKQLVTNYHVVEGGKPNLRVGSVRIECSLEKVDQNADLALLRVPASISAKPLSLSEAEPTADATIFAIGNPAGLERTISQGLVSAQRTIEGRLLLQISAPISPGSSGGPVVDSAGKVVGVAVAYLKDGQNLNFAVPSAAVARLLRGTPESTEDLEELLQQAARLGQEREMINLLEPDTEQLWSQKTNEIDSLLKTAFDRSSGSKENLLSVAATAADVYSSKIAIDAARAAQELLPKDDLRAHRILARMLRAGIWYLNESERVKRIAEALHHAQFVVDRSTKPAADDLFTLASVLEDTSRRAEAFSRYQQALNAARSQKEVDLQKYFRGLFRTSPDLKGAKAWFKELIESGNVSSYDWELLAGRHFEAQEYGAAAEAWAFASDLAPSSEYLCNAGLNYWLSDQLDNALSYYRRCVGVAALEEGTEERLGKAYSVLGAILLERGVYDQAVSYAKQSIELIPEDPWPYFYLSKSLNALGRNGEAATAAESAIRFSDGKFPDMHFALGTAHFDLQNWDRAARAFQKSAELSPDSWTAAYNLALCFQRQGFFKDAAKWFEEVLRRRPDHPDREELLKTIRRLRE